MPARHWSIWSLTPDRSRWMKVEEDLSEREATITAEQRTKVAAEHGMPEAQYVAMPKGQTPGPEHVKTLTAEERVDGPLLGVNTPPAGRWFDDPRQVLAFAHVLGDALADYLDTIDHVLDYFEKPWKWDNEHDAWVKRGQPVEAGQHDWDGFLHDLEVLDS